MSKSIYEYNEYKPFILDSIADATNRGRGLRAELAKFIGCQVAYVSHVLAGDRHFSMEQAEASARFFSLRQDEAEYLLLLVEENRAGTLPLKKFYSRQIKEKKTQNQQIKSRLSRAGKISSDDQAEYYSSWHYQAIRMALTIPSFRTAPAIAKKLQISVERVNKVLTFLLEKGLAKENSGKYETTDSYIHLEGDSPLASKLHANWRVHSLHSLDHIKQEDLHYSAAVTLAEQDYQKVREILLKGILESHKVIQPSKEEKLCVINLDFYEI